MFLSCTDWRAVVSPSLPACPHLSTINNQGAFASASRSVSTAESMAETIQFGCFAPVRAMCRRVHTSMVHAKPSAMPPLLVRGACSWSNAFSTSSIEFSKLDFNSYQFTFEVYCDRRLRGIRWFGCAPLSVSQTTRLKVIQSGEPL